MEQTAPQTTDRIALFETALAISLWAVSFVFIKIALEEVRPVTLIFVRYGIAGAILTALAIRRCELKQLRRRDLGPLFLLGAVGVSLHQLLQVSGQASSDAAVAAFLAATAPAFLVVLAALLLGERVHAGQVAGVLLATLGAGWVAAGGDWRLLTQGQFASPGNGLVLLSAIVWALFTILNRAVVQGRPPTLTTAGMMVFGWALILPLFFAQQGWRDLSELSLRTLGALGYVAFLSTALTYLLYSHALQRAGAGRLAAIQNIEPVVATLAAALLLREPVTLALALGGGAILAGLYLAERKSIA